MAFLLISVNTISNIIDNINNNNNNNNNNRDNNNNNNNLQAMNTNMNMRRSFGGRSRKFENFFSDKFSSTTSEPANLSSVESEVRKMFENGIDPWDEKIFLRLRRNEESSGKRSALEVVHLWLKNVALQFPQCITENACQVFSNFVG
jgi:hypothetical protein